MNKIIINVVDLNIKERIYLIWGFLTGKIGVEIKPDTLRWLKTQENGNENN